MPDIQQEAEKYASSHPYSFTKIQLPDSQNEIRGRFHITKQPDPMIAVIIGDFIHNLRSALDYIIVACVPKKYRRNASFSIVCQDIFAKDKDGKFIVQDNQLRNSFEIATRGLHADARAFVISCEPYQIGSFVYLETLGIISRLENADKHHQLIAIGCGGRDFAISFNIHGLNETFKHNKLLARGSNYLKDNTVIPFKFPPGVIPSIKPSDMEMHISGTTKILVKVPMIGGNKPAREMLLDDIIFWSLWTVKEIIKNLEPFVLKN